MAAVAGGSSATATLVAATVDTVTLDRRGTVELIHHGNETDPIFFRTDGTDPVTAADDCEIVLPGERLTVNMGGDDLRVISAGVPSYSVVNVS